MKRKLLSAGLLLAVLLTALVAPTSADGRNLPPVAGPDFALTSPYDPMAIANVLANDWDPKGWWSAQSGHGESHLTLAAVCSG